MSRLTAELVRDQPARDTALPFQQFPKASHGRATILLRLHEDQLEPPEQVVGVVDGAVVGAEDVAGPDRWKTPAQARAEAEAGAKRLFLPMASVGDIPTIPGELFAQFQTSF